MKCTRSMLGKSNGWKNPFREGKTGEKIIEILMRQIDDSINHY